MRFFFHILLLLKIFLEKQDANKSKTIAQISGFIKFQSTYSLSFMKVMKSMQKKILLTPLILNVCFTRGGKMLQLMWKNPQSLSLNLSFFFSNKLQTGRIWGILCLNKHISYAVLAK